MHLLQPTSTQRFSKIMATYHKVLETLEDLVGEDHGYRGLEQDISRLLTRLQHEDSNDKHAEQYSRRLKSLKRKLVYFDTYQIDQLLEYQQDKLEDMVIRPEDREVMCLPQELVGPAWHIHTSSRRESMSKGRPHPIGWMLNGQSLPATDRLAFKKRPNTRRRLATGHFASKETPSVPRYLIKDHFALDRIRCGTSLLAKTDISRE
ncbi:MAG: hypothetical protein Q9208_004149 [Pyrenodesmia sp. 3 TL-2023]